jgi:hypothetical protein
MPPCRYRRITNRTTVVLTVAAIILVVLLHFLRTCQTTN